MKESQDFKPERKEVPKDLTMKRVLSFSMDKILSKEVCGSDLHKDDDHQEVKRPRMEKVASIAAYASATATTTKHNLPSPKATSSCSTPTSPASSSISSPTSEEEIADEISKETEVANRKLMPEPTGRNKKEPTCSPGFIAKNGITVELVSQELWKKFHKLGTEMIITKAGRRMFPTLKIRVLGLNPTKTYIIFLELVPFDDKRYRYVYHSSQWMVAGAGDPHPSPSTFLHSDSPCTGQAWTTQGIISFDKLKLTNNRASGLQGQICLHSMHKYVPRIHVQEVDIKEGVKKEDYLASFASTDELLDVENSTIFAFPETIFTTVTAYQNQQEYGGGCFSSV